MNQIPARDLLAQALAWADAHVTFDQAAAGLPAHLRGMRPPGAPHSAWELVEHIRITQRDILDFCIAKGYQDLVWPSDYWPSSPQPPTLDAWDHSLQAVRDDREGLERLARDPAVDLDEATPNGSGQTYRRELLLVVDHTAYHVGQLVLVRTLLNAWPPL